MVFSQTNKTLLTDREKACIIYGYTRCMAEEAKQQGLFKDLSIDEIIRLFLTTN